MKMLSTILGLTILLSFSAHASEEFPILANDGDFISIGHISANEIDLFHSYTGVHTNHCGILLRTHSYGPQVEDLAREIEIFQDGLSSAVIKDGQLISSIPKEEYRYGAFFKIKSKSGEPLNKVFKRLAQNRNADVIVEILKCE